MQIVIKKKILFGLIKKALNESRSDTMLNRSSANFLGTFDTDDEPIVPKPHMATQLSVEEPPVEDPEYVPGSLPELSNAASRMMQEVPEQQIGYAYRELHRFLNKVLEKEDQLNFGKLAEAISFVVSESTAMRNKLIQNAALKVASGADANNLAIDLIQDFPEFEGEEPYELAQLIDDANLKLSGINITQKPAEISQPVKLPQKTELPDKPLKTKTSTWEDYDFDDIAAIDGIALKKATNKEQFVLGYNDASKDTTANTSRGKRDTAGMDPDYSEGYQRGYKEFSGEAKPLDKNYDRRPSPKELMKQQEAAIKIDRDKWRDLDLPEVLILIPELYQIIKEIGFKLEVDRYNLMMTGDSVKQANENIRQVFNITHLESFIYWNMMKPYYNKDYALKSMNKHLNVIFDNKYVTPGTKIFKKAFGEALKIDGLDAKEGMSLLALNFVEKILSDVANYNYEPDKNKHLEIVLRNTFATLVSYFEAGKGIDQKNAETTKVYQGNNSLNFANNVKEEYREIIISDFLDKLADKFLVKGFYKIQSGRKLPDNEKKNEYYKYNPIEVNEKATAYANNIINISLKAQAAGNTADLFGDEEQENEGILVDEDSPDGMTDEEISVKLSNTKDFQSLAPFFGPTKTGGSFSSTSGMRQWFLKFAKRFFEMGIIDASKGDRTLLIFHNYMVEYSLKSLSEGLGELVESMPEGELKTILNMCKDQVSQGFQSFIDVGDIHKTTVKGKNMDGSQKVYPFLKSLGGQLTRIVNGAFFERVMVKIDKDWTNYTAEIFSTNKQIQSFIAEQIADNPDIKEIDSDTAGKIAEYWTGKKNKPEIVFDKVLKKKVYVPNKQTGKPTTGARNLLKFGITPDIYTSVKAEANDWFEDMIMTDFARIQVDGGTFKGKYREMIDSDYKKMNSDASKFKSRVLAALDSLITSSSQRQALSNLQDYEVEK